MAMPVEQVREAVASEGAGILIVAAKDRKRDRRAGGLRRKTNVLEEIGLEESGVNRLIRAAYALLNLETYFTSGADETVLGLLSRG